MRRGQLVHWIIFKLAVILFKLISVSGTENIFTTWVIESWEITNEMMLILTRFIYEIAQLYK